MAEASQNYTTLDTSTRIRLVRRINRLIKDNSLDMIKEIFETLQPEQRIKVLNSSIDGTLPLYVAVDRNKIEISCYLLKLSLRQGASKMVQVWKNCRHPLIPAILARNQKLIQVILRQLPDINENISGAASPLKMALILESLMAVELIVIMGADINRTNVYGRTPLMYSTSNSDICRFLINEGANVFHEDCEGFTALHFAAERDHVDSLAYLIKAGADVTTRSLEGITPLIWANIHFSHNTITLLLKNTDYSVLDKIESVEMFGAFGEENLDTWIKTLKRRREENIPKICRVPAQRILDFSEEFTTEIELENLRYKPLAFAYQSILVVERLFGRNNRLYIWYLLKAALVAKRQNKMQKVRQLIKYIQEYCQDKSTYFVAANLKFAKLLFCTIVKDGNSTDFFYYGGFDIYKMTAQAAKNMWYILRSSVQENPFFIHRYYSKIVETFLYMTSKTKTGKFCPQQLAQFREVVTDIVREDIRVKVLQSLLHRAIEMFRNSCCVSVDLLKILLESGADVNSKDYFRRTPLMYALKYVSMDTMNDVLSLLFEYGCHTDCRNSEGFTAILHTPWGRALVPENTPMSLQCLATAVILDNEIPYEGILPEKSEKFVNFHK